RSLHDELGHGALTHRREIRALDGRGYQDEALHRLGRGEPRGDPGAEREARHPAACFWISLLEPAERGASVLELATTFVVRSFAAARAAKVESQHRGPHLVEHRRHAMHHLVVKRTAIERVRMADEGRNLGTLPFVAV